MSTNQLLAYASQDDKRGKGRTGSRSSKKKGRDKKGGKTRKPGVAPQEPDPARKNQPDEEKEGG